MRRVLRKLGLMHEKALANSVDPDETPHDAASHQGLHCLLKEFLYNNKLYNDDEINVDSNSITK
ncbi:hypothetical protein DPMN_098214, partial [Dreissena polymorpha]